MTADPALREEPAALAMPNSSVPTALGTIAKLTAFCFSCHEVRMHGTAVPPALATQFFDAGAPQAHALLALFREAAP